MPTQEERITALEQAIKDLNINSTVLLGLASDHEIDIRKLGVQLAEMRAEAAERSTRLDMRIDGIVASLAAILEKLDERK